MIQLACPNQIAESENKTPEQIAADRFTQRFVKTGFKKQALHVYQDAQGQPVYWRIRLKHPQTGEKWLRPLSRDVQGGFILKEPAFQNGKPLYQLPALLNNVNDTVWVVEGELCADKLTQLGLLATTSGGVDSVSVTDWSPLVKRKVVIWPDNDKAGLKYAHSVTSTLISLGCEVTWIDLVPLHLPAKSDCVDWLAAHPQASYQDVLGLSQITPFADENALSYPVEQPIEQPNTQPTSNKKNRRSVYSSLFKVTSQGVFFLAEEETFWVCGYAQGLK